MTNRLDELFEKNKIAPYEYQMYMLFEAYPLGRDFLKNMCESVFMEESIPGQGHDYAWHDGRRSAWRDIKLVINRVKQILEGKQDDRPEFSSYIE